MLRPGAGPVGGRSEDSAGGFGAEVSSGSPGSQRPGFASPGPLSGFSAGYGEGVGPGADLPLVGVGQLEGEQEGSGGDAADASSL